MWYYNEHLSDIPLQPVDMPLKMEAAGGGTVGYYGQITLEFTIPHLSELFQVKVVVMPDTDYHNIAPLLIRTAVLRHSRDKFRDQYGNWYIQRANLSVAWVHAYQYQNASDNSSNRAKMVKSIKINPGRIVTVLL